jgi:hypothetical protein
MARPFSFDSFSHPGSFVAIPIVSSDLARQRAMGGRAGKQVASAEGGMRQVLARRHAAMMNDGLIVV